MGGVEAAIAEARRIAADPACGYSQRNRWGDDYDCSSFVYHCFAAAGYPLPTGGGQYTGTMLADFTSAGFTAVPFDGNLYDCPPGSIALNVREHTEMLVDWGTFAGAHCDENGDIVGNCPGDQTGDEISVCAAYVFANGWDYILLPPEDGSGYPDPAPDMSMPPIPMYRAKTSEDGWLEWMHGLNCADGCGDDFAGVEGHAIVDIEFANLGDGGWYRLYRADGSESVDESGDVGSPVTGVVVYYATPDPEITGYYKALYRAHWMGDAPEWGKWERDDEDGGAGKDEASPLDMLSLTIEKA